MSTWVSLSPDVRSWLERLGLPASALVHALAIFLILWAPGRQRHEHGRIPFVEDPIFLGHPGRTHYSESLERLQENSVHAYIYQPARSGSPGSSSSAPLVTTPRSGTCR